jgi:ribulose-5-phosphate 4-epimerase/fuculose-1-phosphate aldolase
MNDVQARVSPEEWQTRVDLAAAYRLVAHFGWSDLVFTHITARVPGVHSEFLINPYGMLFDEITASSLVKIDLQGNKLDDNPHPVNPAGFTIHSAIHDARHDAQCVLHVHSLNGVAVSALAYHDYEGIALNEAEKPRLVADLGDKMFYMLRNHGLLTLGPSIADAFLSMYLFEATCTIQVRAMAGGCELVPINPQLINGAKQQAAQVTRGLGGALVWPSLLRKLDKQDTSYRN